MRGYEPFGGDPRILHTNAVTTDGVVRFPVSRRSRALDVYATIRHFNTDPEAFYATTGAILQFAVEQKGLLNNRAMGIWAPGQCLTDAVVLRQYIQFGSGLTMEDVDTALGCFDTGEQLDAKRARVAAAIINTGNLARHVVEVPCGIRTAHIPRDEFSAEVYAMAVDAHLAPGASA